MVGIARHRAIQRRGHARRRVHAEGEMEESAAPGQKDCPRRQAAPLLGVRWDGSDVSFFRSIITIQCL